MAKTLEQLDFNELDTREQQLLDSFGEPNTGALSSSGLDIREQELVQSLKKDGIDVQIDLPPPLFEETPASMVQRDKDIQTLVEMPELTEADPSDVSLNFLALRENIKAKFGTAEPIGFIETFGNTRGQEKVPFIGSLYKFDRLASVFEAARNLTLPPDTVVWDVLIPEMHYVPSSKFIPKIQAKRRRKHDIAIMEEWLIELEEKQARGISIGGRIAEGITELPAFMIEFLLTGVIFKIGSASAKTAATKLLGRYAEKGVGKLAIKVAGAGFGTFVRTGVNVPRILAGAAETMTKGIQITDDGAIAFADADISPFSALARSFVDLYIENLTEIAGPSLKKGVLAVGKGIGKKFPVIQKFTQAISDKWIANRAGRTLSGFLKVSATKLGYDGMLEEMGEEQLGRIIRAVTGLEDFETIVPSWEDLLVEAGIFSVLPIGVSLAQTKIFRKELPIKPVETEIREVLPGIELGVGVIATVEEVKAQKTTVETLSKAVQASTTNASVEATSDIDAVRRNIVRVEDALRHWGSIGNKIRQAFFDISRRTAVNTGNTTQNIRAIERGLNAKEKIIVSQLTDGAISKEGQPARLVERANMLKEQLDIMQNEAIKVGLRKRRLVGKAFPQIANKKGKAFLEEAETEGAKSHRVFAWAQTQVNEGKFETVDSAIAALQNYRRTRLRGTEGYLEGTRTIELDLDMREWSPDVVLPGIIEGAWENIEGARQWGVTEDGNFKSLRTDIERLRSEVGVDQANLLEDYIKAQYGQSRASVSARKWNKRFRAVQFVGKLALSPLTITRNMLDRYAKGLTHGTIGTNIRATIKFPPFLNKWLKTSQRIQDEMIRQGAVLGHGHLSEGFASGGKISRFLGQPFALSERGNQTYIAIVKKLQIEADLKRLNEMGGESGTVGKMYNRMLAIIGQSQQQTRSRLLTNLTNEQLADALSQKKIPDDVMSEVLHRTVTDSAFPLTLASKRMWWGNRPFLQTATQFKVWSADQMRFIYKDVLKYTIATGDPSRLFRFILGTWLAGEIYNIARDFLTDKDESLLATLKDPDGRNVKEISKSIANALVDGGVVGMLADLTYGISDWAFGPTVGSIESIARIGLAVKNDPATTIDGLKKFILDDIPAAKQAQGVLDRIDRTFFDKEDENLTEHYAKWRQRSFEFRRKKGELTVIERATGRAVLGRPARLPGPRTLSLEMLSRQVLVGDFDDAAGYIKGILKDAPIDKVRDVFQGIEVSARNRSPMGTISKKNLPLFLAQFSVESQVEIITLQLAWMEGYKKAQEIAVKELAAEGFKEELKLKAAAFQEEITPQIEKFKSTIKELRELLKEK